MKFLLPYLKKFRWTVALALFFKALSALGDLLIPWMLSYVIDYVIPLGEQKPVYFWGILMILTALFGFLTNIFGNRSAARVSSGTVEKVRNDLYYRISTMSSEGLHEFTIPSLISRVTSDSYIVHRTIGMVIRMGIRAPMLLIGCLGITFFLDPVLALVFVALIPFMFYFSITVSSRGIKLFRNVQHVSDNMIRVLRENVTGVRVIRALSKTEYEKKRFEKVNDEVTQADKTAAYNMAKVNPIISLLLNIGFVLVLFFGAIRINAQAGTVGNIIAFMTYFSVILNSVRMITRVFTDLSKASASISRIEEVMHYADEIVYPEPNGVPEDENAPVIEFRDVSFAYKNGKVSLNHLSFKVNRGETLGVIGTTGSGKTTLVSLLMRFYDVLSGEILLSGKNVKDMTATELRSRFGAVFQNDSLFEDTVAENVAIGRPISEEEIEKALSLAEAADFVRDAGGLEAPVAIKGANFSGGQKQRLLIARALAADPEILILDDSSSALDYKTDAIIRQRLAARHGKKTSVIIAQRVSSVMNADKILVLDHAVVKGFGTHAELLETCPMYRDTYRFQMEN